MANIKQNFGVTVKTKRDIGHPQGLSFGFPPPERAGSIPPARKQQARKV